MMRNLPTTVLTIVGSLAMLLVCGCKQGQNERCQLNSDCDEGLYCELKDDNNPALGGICRSTDAPRDLATVPADLSVTQDLTPAPDLGDSDLGDLRAAD